ncbi:hypothetical protein [Streptomyces sp. NPDC046712]|uniref:hypothetical protein n=1 Tax=Streptomyces sp. NPDC046712 TaxID=3154802 RepID=UPI0033E98E9E
MLAHPHASRTAASCTHAYDARALAATAVIAAATATATATDDAPSRTRGSAATTQPGTA